MRTAGDQEVALTAEEKEQYVAIVAGPMAASALEAACELGLFAFLSKKPGASRDDIQQFLSSSLVATRILLLACCSSGLIRRDPSTLGYHNSGLAEKAFVPDSPVSLIDNVRMMHQIAHRVSRHFRESVKQSRNVGLDLEFPSSRGVPANSIYERLAQDYPDVEKVFHEGMAAYTRAVMDDALSVFDMTQTKHLLDLGGGNGTMAIALCRRFPSLSVTVMDHPSVAAMVEGKATEAGLSERVRGLGRNFDEEWPEGFDGVLLSHLSATYGLERQRELYEKVYRCLSPGGKFFFWGHVSNELETGGLAAMRLSVYYLTGASGRGMAFTAKEHSDLMKSVGFGSVSAPEYRPLSHAGIVATK